MLLHSCQICQDSFGIHTVADEYLLPLDEADLLAVSLRGVEPAVLIRFSVCNLSLTSFSAAPPEKAGPVPSIA